MTSLECPQHNEVTTQLMTYLETVKTNQQVSASKEALCHQNNPLGEHCKHTRSQQKASFNMTSEKAGTLFIKFIMSSYLQWTKSGVWTISCLCAGL